MPILTDLASNLGGSHYFAINTSYSNTAGHWATGTLHYAGSTTDNYSRGTSLTDGAVFGVVSDAITSGRLPLDGNGIYMVLSSADVTEGAFWTTRSCSTPTTTSPSTPTCARRSAATSTRPATTG